MRQTAESSTPALAEPRELFEIVLRHLNDGIVVLNPAGELIYANEAGARLSGYSSAAEMLAAPPGEARARFQIFDVDGSPLAPERLPSQRALAGESPEPMLVRFRAGPGLPDRVSEVRAVAVRGADVPDEIDDQVVFAGQFGDLG